MIIWCTIKRVLSLFQLPLFFIFLLLCYTKCYNMVKLNGLAALVWIKVICESCFKILLWQLLYTNLSKAFFEEQTFVKTKYTAVYSTCLSGIFVVSSYVYLMFHVAAFLGLMKNKINILLSSQSIFKHA